MIDNTTIGIEGYQPRIVCIGKVKQLILGKREILEILLICYLINAGFCV